MKLSQDEIKELVELNKTMGVAIGMIELGIQVKLNAEKYATAFARSGELISLASGRNNARVIGDLQVDENGNCSPLNIQS
jgi:hypothetical protein